MNILPHDSHVSEAGETTRLTSQNAQILARLQQGPATAHQLAELSLKYTSRVSDLRHAGYDVRCREEAGQSTYFLVNRHQGHDTNAPSAGRLL